MLNLEVDLPVSEEDCRALRQPPPAGVPPTGHRDLAQYIAFLEEIGAFKTKKTDVTVYPEQFEL